MSDHWANNDQSDFKLCALKNMLLLKDMHLMLQMSAQSFLNRRKNGKNKKNELVKRGMLFYAKKILLVAQLVL